MISRAFQALPKTIRWKVLVRMFGGSNAARHMGMKIGEDCRIYSCNVAAEEWLVEIGDRVTVSSEVLFVTHDGTGWLFRQGGRRPVRYGRIAVGSDSFIGARAVLLPGVRVGNRCVVAAGTVVHRSVPDGSIVGGNPARLIGSYEDLGKRARSNWAEATGSWHDIPRRKRIDAVVESDFLPMLDRSVR